MALALNRRSEYLIPGGTSTLHYYPNASKAAVNAAIGIQNGVWHGHSRIVAYLTSLGEEYDFAHLWDEQLLDPVANGRVRARAHFTLRPGCRLFCIATIGRSALDARTEDSGGDYTADGTITLECDLDNGTDQWDVEFEMSPFFPPSDGEESTYVGGNFLPRNKREMTALIDPKLGTNVTGILKTSRGVKCEFTATASSSMRIFDLVLYEVADTYASVSSDGNEYAVTNSVASTKNDFPATQNSSSNYAGGQRSIHDVIRGQRRHLGNAICNWSGFQDNIVTVADEVTTIGHRAGVPVFTGTNILGGSQTHYDPDNIGLSVNCGAFMRPYIHNSRFVSKGRFFTVPVIVALYVVHSKTSHFRITSGDGSWIDMRFTSSDANGWYYKYGHLQVDGSPGGNRILQVICVSVDNGDVIESLRMRVAAFSAEYIGGMPKWVD